MNAAADDEDGGGAADDSRWRLIYSQDWSEGVGPWSAANSYLHDKRAPKRLHVGRSLAEYVMWFDGRCGWALRSGGVSGVTLKFVSRVFMLKSHRNALSVNIRNTGGRLMCKYSMGEGNSVVANCQPSGHEDQPVQTAVKYALRHPYDLICIFEPGRGFYLGLKDLLTGETEMSLRRWSFKGSGTPATIDFDQEGGYGPAALGLVEVHILEQ
jgi:hypothetical protein